MSFYSGTDNDFNKKLIQFEPDNIIRECKSGKFSLSNEIREATRAIEAMDYILQNPLGSVQNQSQQQPNVYNTMNVQNIQNNHYQHHHYYNNSQNSVNKFTRKHNKKYNTEYIGNSNNTNKKYKERKSYYNKSINQSNNNVKLKAIENKNVKEIKTKIIKKNIVNNTGENTSMNTIKNTNNRITNNNVKQLYNTNYIENLKTLLNKVLSFLLVTDFYNYNKKGQCGKCKIVTFHTVNICNSCQNKLCINCFYQLFSGLKTTEGKNNYHNSKSQDCSSFKVFLKTLSQEITCHKCKKESTFSKLAKNIDSVIKNNELDSKSFYKWKKLSDMKYFEKDNWSLLKNKYHTNCQNVNKDKLNNYSFSISYHPKKDVFTISLNSHLLKLYNFSNSNSISKIELYYPYQNNLFVDTAYQGLEKIMLQCKSNCLHNNNINGLINKWNSYCYQFNSILVRYKEQKRNYSCNDDLNNIIV